MDVPIDLGACRFDCTAGGFDDLRARAVTRDQRDGVTQDALPKALRERKRTGGALLALSTNHDYRSADGEGPFDQDTTN
jgi:hypothetical protein